MKKPHKNIETLIRAALNEEDENLVWKAIESLQCRGDREVLIAAQKLCEIPKLEERILGANILGQLGIPERAFPEGSVNTLLKTLESEQNEYVIASILIALSHYKDIRVIDPIVALKNHLNADIRYGVAVSLKYETPLAISTLIELTSDEDRDVRNWATFSLGSMIDTNTEEIREALHKRLVEEESDYEIFGEALVGLARRKDERVIAPLMQELLSDEVGELALEAAEEVGDPRLYPLLLKVKEWWNGSEYSLEEAIAKCKAK
jgi:HEAT repeat protein